MEENKQSLFCISPIDGRYRKMTQDICHLFSEYALIQKRIEIEIKWILFLLGEKPVIKEVVALSKEERNKLEDIIKNFDIQEANEVKRIESITNHDVKAIEYYLREKIEKDFSMERISSLIHFACTSEDINNLAYGLMIKQTLEEIWIPEAEKLIKQVKQEAKNTKEISMLSHTHGQSATPTTVGKEFIIFVYRLEKVLDRIKNISLTGKWNGTVGNFNAHNIAYPNMDWKVIAKEFVEAFGLEYNPYTTQIESHDTLARLSYEIKLFNTILMDFNNDMWTYISMRYFKQKVIEQEIGSSVMPHKVNPIHHENSMANIRMANAIWNSLAENLPICRMQRDLSDSSMLRNIGVAFAHSMIAIKQSEVGLSKMEVNEEILKKELEENPEVLAEAIQTILRKNGYTNAYELLKEMTRGKTVTLEEMRQWVATLTIAEEDKKRLESLTPDRYIGYASKLVESYEENRSNKIGD